MRLLFIPRELKKKKKEKKKNKFKDTTCSTICLSGRFVSNGK